MAAHALVNAFDAIERSLAALLQTVSRTDN
jgi:hypothetical protein